MAELVITATDGDTRSFSLSGAVTLGRDPSCEIPLDDLGTSRQHARIRPEGDGYVVEDLGSKNGTILNDFPCKSARLKDGDEVILGSVRVVFRDPQARAETATSVILSDQAPSQKLTKFSGHTRELLIPQRRLKMLYELSERVTRLRDRSELLEDVLNICFETLQFERGAIALRKRDGRGVEWPVVRNLQGPGGELTVSRSVLSRALDHGERAVINDTGDADFDPTVSMVQLGIRSALCVPLLHDDKVLGVVYGDRTSTGTKYTDEDVDFLAGLARQVSIGLINVGLMEEQRARVALQREITLARQIQQRLFPSVLPDRAELQVAARNDPGRHVSGDYYDVIELDDGRVAFVVADVTGEGVAASLLMSNLQAAVRLTMVGEVDPAALLLQWNRLTYANTEASKFVTCLVGMVDPKARQLALASAGHHTPYVVRSAPGACSEIECEPGYPLGIVEQAEYYTAKVELGAEPCALFCYTDGVVEAMDSAGDQFGSGRMIEALRTAADIAPQSLIQQTSSAITTFCGEATQSDDITMLALRLA
jgi:sigma-B regulation protein RsbU (phosphoserine phosphatase)